MLFPIERGICGVETEKLIELEGKARELLAQGEFSRAAKAFERLLRHVDSLPARNNLAHARFMLGDYRGALEVLAPYLGEEGGGNPFTYALAARIFCALQQKDVARRWLERAVRAFDEGLSLLRRGELDQDRQSFFEYTAAVMRAAGCLGEHRYVFDLYRRWEMYHVSWENKFLAGAACFNMGRYKRAASFWASIGGVSALFLDMQQVALLVERGAVPPFEMGYEVYTEKDMERALKGGMENGKAVESLINDGRFLMLFLSYAVAAGNSKAAQKVIYGLVRYGGEWGEKLGRQLMQHATVEDSWKLEAANALVARGVLREDEPVEMVIGGERRKIRISQIEIVGEQSEELDKVVKRAVDLSGSGRTEEAIELLRGLSLKGKFYPPAVLALASLLYKKGELDEALKLLETLNELYPDQPYVLFNLAAVMLQMGDVERARAYYRQIDPRGKSKDFLESLKFLGEQIALRELAGSPFDDVVAVLEEDFRKEVEKKPLATRPPLARGLKNMPAGWLKFACQRLNLEPARLRGEREKQITAYLTERSNLERVVNELPAAEIELLRYLVDRGGWARLGVLTRKFGSMEGDGFFWGEGECRPASPLGNLWSRALVMVGTAKLGGRKCKIAAVPVELRELLMKVLSASAEL